MLLPAIFPLLVSAGAHSRQSDEVEVGKIVSGFIAAFDNLDWDQFRGFFAEDETVFFPRDSPIAPTDARILSEHFSKSSSAFALKERRGHT